MTKDTARSLLGIVEGALEEGDRNIADEPDKFDKFTLDFHNEMKASLTRDVLDPIHAEFPTDVVGPVDLIGHKVWFPTGDDFEKRNVEGLVTARDSHNSAHVIIVDPNHTGKHQYSVHWLLCRADLLRIMG
jgi:hypothetical protein